MIEKQYTIIFVGLILCAILVVHYWQIASAERSRSIVWSEGRVRILAASFGRSLLRRLRFWFVALLVNRERRQGLQEAVQTKNAEDFALQLGNMKGVFMKIGQIVSFAAESLPENVRAVLEGLQQDAPPMHFSVVEQCLIESYGPLWHSLFLHFDENPVAAASIGQVHKAILSDGTKVAVKIQYPGVSQAIANDLKSGDTLVTLMRSFNRNMDADAVLSELRDRLMEELDYRKEAENQEAFAHLWQGHPLVLIPTVHKEFSTDKILVQEFVEGLRFGDFMAIATQEEKSRAAMVMTDFVWESMFRHRIFNADPHPGNYLFRSDGAIYFLDYGCVKRFSKSLLQNILGLYRSLVEDDRASFLGFVDHLNIVLPGRKADEEFLWKFFRYHAGPYLEDRVFKFDSAWLKGAAEVTRMMDMQKLNLPPDLIFFNRITFGLNSIFARLGAEANFHQLYKRYLFPEEK